MDSLPDLKSIPEVKRPIVLHKYLSDLEVTLPKVDKAEIKANQKKLVSELLQLVETQSGLLGPPIRQSLAKVLTVLFVVGDTFTLFEVINKCNDLLKNKDDSPSYLPTRLTAINILGHMYETLGRMTGRSYDETVQLLSKGMKNAESRTRAETMVTLGKICSGLGNAANNVHWTVYKMFKQAMSGDRSMPVRSAAASAMLSLAMEASFVITSELENVAVTCFKAFDGANYETRKSVANCLGSILSLTQKSGQNHGKKGIIQQSSKSAEKDKEKTFSLEDCLNILQQGFLKGGSGSGLIKGASPVPREVRVGVTHCYVVLAQKLGSKWLEKNLSQYLQHILSIVSHPKVNTSHVEVVYARKCVGQVIHKRKKDKWGKRVILPSKHRSKAGVKWDGTATQRHLKQNAPDNLGD